MSGAQARTGPRTGPGPGPADGTGPGWIRVPVSADPGDEGRWATRGGCLRVLLVVHNVTSATRLLDVLPLFRDDLRVQLLATCTGSSPFRSGVRELLEDAGLPVLPWEQAVRTPVRLALSASYGGQLERIQGKLAILSHGAGYNKKLATPDTGHRITDGGRRPSCAEGDGTPVFGLSPEWLLHEGRPLADATVLSHPEQLDRLRASCPQAAPTAVLAGDPCFDRLLAARAQRDRFRRALGVARGQRLIVLNSTWNPDSLFGDGGGGDANGSRGSGSRGGDTLPALLPRLTAELPADEYRIAAVLHPNIWHGHGPGQIRMWLQSARRAGLTLVDPLEGWRQALLAADCVLGDQGSVSFYAAALGTPVLLGAAPRDGLDPRSPVAAFVRAAPRLRLSLPLRPQLDEALRDGGAPGGGPPPETDETPSAGGAPRGPGAHADGTRRGPNRAAELVSSVPGRSAALLRRAFYGLIGVPEPPGPALLEPLPLPPYEPARITVPLRVLTRVPNARTAAVEVARYPDPPREPRGAGAAHTAVPEESADPERLGLADVILRHAGPEDPRLGPPEAWTAETLARHPYCALAAYVTGPGQATVRRRDGTLIRLAPVQGQSPRPDATDAGAYVSALYGWLMSRAPKGTSGPGLPAALEVRTGETVHRVALTVLPAG